MIKTNLFDEFRITYYPLGYERRANVSRLKMHRQKANNFSIWPRLVFALYSASM